MPPIRSVVIQPKSLDHEGKAYFFRVRFRTFEIPAVRDAMILGKTAPANLATLLEMLKLGSADSFIGCAVQDDVVGAIAVRQSVLKKLPRELIEKFVLLRVKPYMTAAEIIQLDLDLEIVLEANV